MRLGAIVLQTRPWHEAQRVWRQVEQVGFDIGYVADHLTHPSLAGRWLADGWTTLTAAAAVTDRIELGTLVTSAAVRDAVPLARVAATTNDVSGGRVVLGLGAGSPLDAAAVRAVSPTPRQLARRFADTVEALVQVWAGTGSWTGQEQAFAGLDTAPLPPGGRPPPLLLAAHGPSGFRLAARHADGWSTYGGPASVQLAAADYWALLRRQVAEVTAACERLGRDPTGLRRSLLLGYGTLRPLESAATFAEAVSRAEDAGFDELVVYWPEGRRGDRFWADEDVVREAVAGVRP